MTNPVLRALLNARIQEEPTAFGKWCVVHGFRSLPASPVHVAAFITESGAALTPVETVWQMVRAVSEAHIAQGLADPTVGGPVARAMNSVSKIGPPGSWPKDHWPRFFDLPFDLQQYLLERDKDQRREIGRAHREAAEARKALAAIQQPKEPSDGIQQSPTAQ